MKYILLFLLLPLISFGQFDFEEIMAPDDFSLSAIRQSPIGEYFVQATNDLDHVYSSFNGIDWTKSSLPSIARIEDVIFYNNGTPVLSSKYSSEEYMIRRDGSWYHIPEIDESPWSDPMVFFTKNDTLFAYQDQNFVYSVDSGVSFTIIFQTTTPLVATNLVKFDGYYVLYHSEGSNNSFSVFNDAGTRVLFEGLHYSIDQMVSGECNEILFHGNHKYVLLKMDGLIVEEGNLPDIDINLTYGNGTILSHGGSYYYQTESSIYKTSDCNFNWELLTGHDDLLLYNDFWPFVRPEFWVTPEKDIIFNAENKNFYWKWSNTNDSWTKAYINISYPDVIKISESFNNEQFALTNNFLFTKNNNVSSWNELDDEDYFPYSGADYSPEGTLYFFRQNELNYSTNNGITYTNIELPDFTPEQEDRYKVEMLAEDFIFIKGVNTGYSFYSEDNGENWTGPNAFSSVSSRVKLIDDYLLFSSITAPDFAKLSIESQVISTDNLTSHFHWSGTLTSVICDDGKVYLYFIEGFLPSSETGLYQYSFGEDPQFLGTYPELENLVLRALPDGELLVLDEDNYYRLDGDILTAHTYPGIPSDIYGEKQFYLSQNHHLFVVEGGHRIFRSSEPLYDVEVSTTSLEIEENFAIFPNPVNEVLNITLEEFMVNQQVTLELHNQLGQLVYDSAILTKETRVDVAKLLPGLYYVVIKKDGKNRKTERFVKI